MWCAGLFWPSFLHKSWRSHTLNSQPVCLTEGQIVFPLCFSRLILHLNLLHQPSYLRSASLPISFPTKFFSYKLVISTFLLLLSFKLLVHALLSSKWSVACTNLSVLTLRGKKKRESGGSLLLSMSNPFFFLASADGCQTLQSQTLCSAGIQLWSLLTNGNGLFLSGGILADCVKQGFHQGRPCIFFAYCFTNRNLCKLVRREEPLRRHVTRYTSTFCSLSVINVWAANPSCTYDAHHSVTDFMHTQTSRRS